MVDVRFPGEIRIEDNFKSALKFCGVISVTEILVPFCVWLRNVFGQFCFRLSLSFAE